MRTSYVFRCRRSNRRSGVNLNLTKNNQMTPEQNATRLVQKFTPSVLGELTTKQALTLGVLAASLHLIEICRLETPEPERLFIFETLSAINKKYGNE